MPKEPTAGKCHEATLVERVRVIEKHAAGKCYCAIGEEIVYQGVRLRGLSSAGRSLRNQGGALANWVAAKVPPWRDDGREEEEASAVIFGFVYLFCSGGGRLRSGKEEGGRRKEANDVLVRRSLQMRRRQMQA